MNILTELLFSISVERKIVNYLVILSYLLTTTPLFLSIFQLTFVMHLLQVRFKVLNEILLEYFVPENVKENVKEKDVKKIDKRLVLDDLIKLHDQLSDGLQLINSTCTFQMIPVLSVFLSNGIFALHSIVKQYFFASNFFSAVVFNNCFWFTYYMSMMSFMLRTGSKTTNEIKRTSVIALKILMNLAGEGIGRKLELFNQQIKQREKVVRNDFFIIDWSLMFTMLSSITTLLIITCQFDITM